ncbi:Nitric oxide dioxygenase [Tritonibacter multivorans]|uniref:Nitric oxide dioxygenase n=1 Tax=Tritonibacter multivorans TaxID=928856 RepID=A0A0N7LZA9_9RHOB|nr:globin family protein [Tritonibacter multivorans]MDA7422645.1 globin family protein [Tritonibacter multivorans]CUH77153.1 Nitric oxide dioxygenase [Tritonibacter multivorans]SFD51394.1 nitric oxide dioxygenase [Tritonibacter multivorans]
MHESEIQLVQASFAKVAPIADQAAGIFYDRLFEIAPHVKPYFKGDMKVQGAKLMTTLGVVVKGLRDLDKIVPVAQQLAIGHVAYGVTPEDYAPVGEALIYALKTGLGDDFTPDTANAWIRAYETLSSAMIEAAYSKAAE